MIEPHLEKIYYHYVRQNVNLFDIVTERFFTIKTLQECYKIDHEWYKKYYQIPSKSQIILTLKQYNPNEISEDEIETIFQTNINEYENAWLKENAEAWIDYCQLSTSFYDAASLVKNAEINTSNIKDIVNSVKDIFYTRNNIDFSFNTGLDFFNPELHYQPTSNTFTTGYPFLDVCMDGGWELGALIFFMGQPKIGKSTILCNMAANSIQFGYNTLYLTFEMSEKKIIKRIGSNLLNIPINEYDQCSKNVDLIKEKLQNIGDSTLKEPGKLFIKQWPASSAGVPDIENYIKKLQELSGLKYTVVIIDYINIMKNWRNPNTENTFIKIKQIAEDLRAMATRLSCCLVSATQVGKQGYNSSNIQMSDVSESRAIIETADAVFALQQDMVMKMSGTLDIKAIALRNADGIGQHKTFNINYNHMRLTEDPNSAIILDNAK